LSSGNELLRHLHRSAAFHPTPDTNRLAAYYVPFSELAPPSQPERKLRETLAGRGSVSLVGGRGVGKSSMIEAVLGPLEESLAPIPVRMGHEPEQTIIDADLFVRHVCATIVRYAREADSIGDAEARDALRDAGIMARSSASRTIKFGAPKWMLTGEVSREVSQTAESIEDARSAAEVWDVIARVVDVIRHQNLAPVIVFDDTDRWLRVPGVDHTSRVAAFFGQSLRSLVDVGAPLVVAVHNDYLSMEAYPRLTEGLFTNQVTVPSLATRDALRRVIDRRVECETDGASNGSDVFSEAAVDRLFVHYETVSDGRLRSLIALLSAALGEAAEYGEDVIDEPAIETAIADRPPD
jgi:hypothetical protein